MINYFLAILPRPFPKNRYVIFFHSDHVHGSCGHEQRGQAETGHRRGGCPKHADHGTGDEFRGSIDRAQDAVTCPQNIRTDQVRGAHCFQGLLHGHVKSGDQKYSAHIQHAVHRKSEGGGGQNRRHRSQGIADDQNGQRTDAVPPACRWDRVPPPVPQSFSLGSPL